MQKIKYTFADGTTNEIEVTDEIYALHLQYYKRKSATIGGKRGGIPHPLHAGVQLGCVGGKAVPRFPPRPPGEILGQERV